MKLELTLPDLSLVPISCWWWSGLVLYLLVCWLLIGPIWSRQWARLEYADDEFLSADDAVFVWLFSPVTLLLYIPYLLLLNTLFKPIHWLIFGGSK